MKKTTHFGFKEVPIEEKTNRVRKVFNSVATRYDLMNDLMSSGLHRLWKRVAIETIAIRPGMQILDLASGTGDLARGMSRRAGSEGHVVMTDINERMLHVGRNKCIDNGELKGLSWCQCDAETLPYPDEAFDRVVIGFGLRNVTDKVRSPPRNASDSKANRQSIGSRIFKTSFCTTLSNLRRLQFFSTASHGPFCRAGQRIISILGRINSKTPRSRYARRNDERSRF